MACRTWSGAEQVLVDAARRLDPARLRRVLGHLRLVADPDGAAGQAQRRHARRGLWLSPTLDGMVAVDGLLEPKAGQTLLAALEPLTRPADAEDARSGGQRRADALCELARRTLEGGRLPLTGGVRPQLLVTVDLASLQGRSGLGGDTDTGPLDPEACRRLACDGALTRVLVTRHPSHKDLRDHPGHDRPGDHEDLAARLRTAMALLPPVLGGAPAQPLEVGRSSRVVSPAQRAALTVRDGGCGFPGCHRPLAWCQAHHRATGCTAAPPTWPAWPCCAGPTIGRSTRAAGNSPAPPTAPSPPTPPQRPHRRHRPAA